MFQGLGDETPAPDGFLEGLPEQGVKPPLRVGQSLLRHPEGSGDHAVETPGILGKSLGAPVTDLVAHSLHRIHGAGHIQRGSGDMGPVFTLDGGQVNRSKHGRSVYSRDAARLGRRSLDRRLLGPEDSEQHHGRDGAKRSDHQRRQSMQGEINEHDIPR